MGILDKSFKYDPACATDFRKRFRRIRRARKKAEERGAVPAFDRIEKRWRDVR